MEKLMLRNITLSAEESQIAAARERAREEHTTLNALFREWLEHYATWHEDKERKRRAREFDALMERLKYVKIGRKFTREEMNARR